MAAENLGPAERIINTITTFADHIYHGRCGVVSNDTRSEIGVSWKPATYKEEGDDGKVAYLLSKVGKKTARTRLGPIKDDGSVGQTDYKFRQAGLFPEAIVYIYRQIAAVFQMDNEFAAKWASWTFNQDHRDMKVMLAAFMLVQNRSGAPVKENGQVIFRDEDFRSVGEAMILGSKFDPKMILRVGDVLALPQVAAINRELGFGVSQKRAFMGRYHDVVTAWLRHRELNPKLLENLVKAGFKSSVKEMARRVGYKPETSKFFSVLGWKQKQSKDGHRTIGIGEAVTVESWAGLSEKDICEIIQDTKPNFKRIVGLLPEEIGLTRAIMVAAMASGSMSNTDILIASPTIEALGLLNDEKVKKRWTEALEQAESRRAANIAKNMKTTEAADKLDAAADKALQKAVGKVVEDRNMRIYVCIDKSSSMQMALERAKTVLAKFIQGFPADRLHVSVFNTIGSEVVIRHISAAGVAAALKGHTAGGGTSYSEGVMALLHRRPKPDEDVVFWFIGDQEEYDFGRLVSALRNFNPVALAMLDVKKPKPEQWVNIYDSVVARAGAAMGIPVVPVDERIFDDPYASVRALRDLIASTPVSKGFQAIAAKPKVSLVDTIMKVPLLKKPTWAYAA